MPRKRSNGEGTIFKDKKGVWIAEISYLSNGKRKRKRKRSKSRADASANLREMQNESDLGIAVDQSEVTISVFLTRWLEKTVKANCEYSTYTGRKHAIEKHITPYIGRIKLKKLTVMQGQQLVTDLQESGVNSPTIHKALEVLSLGINQAIRWEIVASNPLRYISKPKNKRREIVPFTREECIELLLKTEGDFMHAFIALGVGTGMRQGEMFGLEWSHVNFETGLISISQQAAESWGRIEVKEPKTAHSVRSIQIPEFCVDALSDHRALLMQTGLAASEFVFPDKSGGVIRRSNFGARRWKPLLAGLGIDHRGAHHLRHTYATIALNEGTPIPVVSKILGHANPSITLKIYSHVLPDDQNKSIQVMQSLFA